MRLWVNCLTKEDHPQFGVQAKALQPSIRAEFLRREHQNSPDFVPMLKCMGYHVRYIGFTDLARRKTLSRILEDDLPDINGAEYMNSWGSPGSTQRCREMQRTIGIYLSRYGDQLNMSIAAERWEDDLLFLRGIEGQCT